MDPQDSIRNSRASGRHAAAHRDGRHAKAVADRWVNAIHPGYSKGYVSATDVKIDPEAKLITFRAYYVDGGANMSALESISTRYIWGDDSTLEADAKTWKAAEDVRQAAIRARIEELKTRPEVIEYMCLSTYQSTPPGCVAWSLSSWGTHDLIKETPKP